MNWKQVKSIKIKEGDVKSLSINSQVVWKKEEKPPVEDHRFRFKNVSPEVNTLKLVPEGSIWDLFESFEKSSDGDVYEKCNLGTGIELQPGETVYLRGNVYRTAEDYNKYNHFTSTHPIECHGRLTDLTGGKDPQAESTFRKLFCDMTTLLTAPELPSMKLRGDCYNGLFRNCTSLKEPPALPATTLIGSCYVLMFGGCTSLERIPELPAISTAPGCYANMFSGCTNITSAEIGMENYSNNLLDIQGMFNDCSKLNYIKVHAKNWGWSNRVTWVDGVSPTGTFVKPVATNIPVGTKGIPSGWTVENI